MSALEQTNAFMQLGLFIKRHVSNQYIESEKSLHNLLHQASKDAEIQNPWFTTYNITLALNGISFILNKSELKKTPTNLVAPSKTVAIIAAGNIPAVGFHDVLCVLLSGHNVLLKMASNDQIIIPCLLKIAGYYSPNIKNRIKYVQAKLQGYDAVIATGSSTSSAQFKQYFKHVPNILRHSRSSVAIITGNESDEELTALGDDVFQYFGLGCRNVSKIYVPENYKFDKLYEAFEKFQSVINHHKYYNNYTYNKTLLLLNAVPHLDNHFLLVTNSNQMKAPMGVLFYENYSNLTSLKSTLLDYQNQLQCLVSRQKISGFKHITFGQSQSPSLFDFADDINTFTFLSQL